MGEIGWKDDLFPESLHGSGEGTLVWDPLELSKPPVFICKLILNCKLLDTRDHTSLASPYPCNLAGPQSTMNSVGMYWPTPHSSCPRGARRIKDNCPHSAPKGQYLVVWETEQGLHVTLGSEKAYTQEWHLHWLLREKEGIIHEIKVRKKEEVYFWQNEQSVWEEEAWHIWRLNNQGEENKWAWWGRGWKMETAQVPRALPTRVSTEFWSQMQEEAVGEFGVHTDRL